MRVTNTRTDTTRSRNGPSSAPALQPSTEVIAVVEVGLIVVVDAGHEREVLHVVLRPLRAMTSVIYYVVDPLRARRRRRRLCLVRVPLARGVGVSAVKPPDSRRGRRPARQLASVDARVRARGGVAQCGSDAGGPRPRAQRQSLTLFMT